MNNSTPKQVALLLIGQSQPEPDQDWSQVPYDIIVISPLDSYTVDELLTKFKPLEGEMPISSTTKSGERILVSKSLLVPELNQAIQECETKGILTIVLDCTGDFDLVASTAKVIFPGKVLHERASQREWKPTEKVAVLVPVDEQQSFLTERWVHRLPKTVDVKAFTMTPKASVNEASEIARKLVSEGYTAAIMDCFGYSLAQGNAVEAQGLDVYLAKGVTIDALASVV